MNWSFHYLQSLSFVSHITLGTVSLGQSDGQFVDLLLQMFALPLRLLFADGQLLDLISHVHVLPLQGSLGLVQGSFGTAGLVQLHNMK